jgi:hypothetical protein
MLKVDQVHVIRHKVLVDGRSRRQVAKEFGISRVTVRKYVEGAEPGRREPQPRARPVWAQVGPRIEALLTASKDWTGGKQQLMATRLHELLIGEGHRVGASLVKAAVAEWKRQRREVFVPLTYRPGDLAEVDFFEVLVDVDGMRRKAWLFLMRLMYSGRDFAWIYERHRRRLGSVRPGASRDEVPSGNPPPPCARVRAGDDAPVAAHEERSNPLRGRLGLWRRTGRPPRRQVTAVASSPFDPSALLCHSAGGRTWWAHLEFTRMNIAPTIP